MTEETTAVRFPMRTMVASMRIAAESPTPIVMTARDLRQLAASIPQFEQTLRTAADERHPLTQSD
jgi:hypothetical protein